MWPFRRAGESGFSSSSTAEEVLSDVDGSGLTAVVTGASGGIGLETARVLAKRGVNVVMGVRNMESGKTAQTAILKENPSGNVDVMILDLSSMASVRNFASNYNSKSLPLNILINNAGIMATPFALSKDGIEMQFATNHIGEILSTFSSISPRIILQCLGHFLLTKLLLETMRKTAIESNRKGRIVNVASRAHHYAYSEGIRFDQINDQSSYNKYSAYGQSKLANILHANELAKRLKGAATTCYVALHPKVEGVSGQYFSDCNLEKTKPLGRDADLAKRLWDFSCDLVR